MHTPSPNSNGNGSNWKQTLLLMGASIAVSATVSWALVGQSRTENERSSDRIESQLTRLQDDVKNLEHRVVDYLLEPKKGSK